MPPTLTDSDRAAYNAAAAKVETKKAEIARIEGEEKEWIEQREQTLKDLTYTPDDKSLKELLEFVDSSLPELRDALEIEKKSLEKAQKKLDALPKPADPQPEPVISAPAVATDAAEASTSTGSTRKPFVDPDRVFMLKEKVMAYHPYDSNRERKLKPGKVIMRHQRNDKYYYLIHFIGKEYQYPDGTLKNEKHELPAEEVKPNFAADKARAETKRKADELEASTAAMQKRNGVISGPADINPDLIRREPKRALDGPVQSETYKKHKTIENNRVYTQRRNNWQEFQAKGKVAKRTKTESMFRTEEGNMNARVGVIGSGKAMTKDRGRQKHDFGSERDRDRDRGWDEY